MRDRAALRPSRHAPGYWIESLFSHIKADWPHLELICDAAVLRAELASVRHEYNTKRLHAGTGYNSKSRVGIANASVNCGSRYSAKTANSGVYSIANVDSGRYDCTASASNYRSSTQSVKVDAGQTIIVNFSLARN